jgi:hypothetical protein
MKVNGKMELKKVMVSCSFLMEISTKVYLIKIALMDMVFIHSQMAINIKENFFKGYNMGEEFIHMLDVVIMMDNGLMEGKKEKDK